MGSHSSEVVALSLAAYEHHNWNEIIECYSVIEFVYIGEKCSVIRSPFLFGVGVLVEYVTSEVDSFEMHIREKIDSSVYSSDTMKNLLRISLIHLVGKYNIYVKCWMLNPDFV